MDFEDGLAAADVGPIDQHVAVESPGRSKAGSSVSGRLVAAMTITPLLDVKPSISTSRALSVCSRSWSPPTMLVPRVLPRASNSSMNTMHGALALACSNMSRTRASDADEHFDEIGAREAEERDARLAGDGLGQQRLSGARRTDQQHAPGNPPAQDLILLGGLEEIDHLAEFVDRFVDAGHLVEGDAHFLLGMELAAAASEGDGGARPAHLAEHEEHQDHQQRRHHHRGQVIRARSWARLARHVGKSLLQQQIEQVVLVVFHAQPVAAEGTRVGLLGMRREHFLGHGAGDFQGTDFCDRQVRVAHGGFLARRALDHVDRRLRMLVGRALLDQAVQFADGDFTCVSVPTGSPRRASPA